MAPPCWALITNHGGVGTLRPVLDRGRCFRRWQGRGRASRVAPADGRDRRSAAVLLSGCSHATGYQLDWQHLRDSWCCFSSALATKFHEGRRRAPQDDKLQGGRQAGRPALLSSRRRRPLAWWQAPIGGEADRVAHRPSAAHLVGPHVSPPANHCACRHESGIVCCHEGNGRNGSCDGVLRALCVHSRGRQHDGPARNFGKYCDLPVATTAVARATKTAGATKTTGATTTAPGRLAARATAAATG